MNSAQFDIVKALIEEKKYDVITEYSHITHPEKGEIIVNEYAGNGVRVYKDNKGNTRVLCPKNIDVTQEGYVAKAIANGTIFDDADEVDRNATMIERTSIPYDAMVNSGKDTPKQLKPMIAIVIGRMDDNGSFEVSDADRTNGTNFVRDLCDKGKCPDATKVVDNYLEKDSQDFYSPEMGRDITALDDEVDDIVDTSPEDVVTDDDTVDSYDDYDMEKVESDPSEETPESEEESENESDDEEESKKSDDNEDDDSEDESVEECGDVDTTVEECGDGETPVPTDAKDQEIQEQTTPPTEATSQTGALNTIPMPASAQAKTVATNKEQAKGSTVTQEGGEQVCKSSALQPPTVQTEGFLSKKPKKLKPIGRDVVAYITVEMNDIHSANDQAMLAGYTCSKIELVDFYLTVLDTQDARYIVPHNKQYLTQMRNDLERLLAQILRIRPINRSEQIWRVNYPTQ